MEQMIAPYRRYFDFQGRSRRSEFWMFALFQFLVAMGAMVIIMIVAAGSSDGAGHANPAGTAIGGILMLALGLFSLGSIIPGLATTVRRLHDSDKSGWMLLIGLIPFGGIVLLIFYCLDGTPGPNRYGPDPKGRGGAQTAAVFS